jgi:site-specific recombinase XerD
VDDHGPLTVALMAQWARQDKWARDDPTTWARRLKLLRPFTRYLRQFEPRTEVPDESVFGPIQERLTPHIYREQEIVDLLAAARALGPPGGLRPATYETLFGLIAAAGLRVSEAVHLLETDVDLKLGLLTIRRPWKSRQLPLCEYARRIAVLSTPAQSPRRGHARDAVLRLQQGYGAEPAASRARVRGATPALGVGQSWWS